ncbi:MAG: hypothetical protein R6W86_05085 [Marinobacter sp.]|uniref:hypothetical protein n=1 Tax=Marinobacter sp. TaxID=50741 RepID=UPI00396F0BEB
MPFKHGLWISLSALLLAGCSSGEDAIDGARTQTNDFAAAKNPLDDFSSGSTGDSSNAGDLEPNEVRITLEVPGSVAPDAEITRRNLRLVEPETLSVYTTNTSLQNLGSVEVTTREDSEGFTIIAFPDGQPLAPDVVIEATYGNARMRALATDSDQDVKINPFSEYLVRNTLASYTPGQLETIRDCVNDAGGGLCLNKYVWSTLADQVHDFEIDIPGNLDVTGALSLLEGRADFARYVAAMGDYALLDDSSSGKISASSADYNSVFLGVELGQSFAEPSISGTGLWGMRTAYEERLEDRNGVGYVYPALTLTSLDAFNIKVTSLATDIPYEREVLLHSEGNDFFLRGSEFWEQNTHSSSPGAATLLGDTRLLAGRALYQSITGRDSARIIGWTRNPHYLDAYTSPPADETVGPDRVVGGYFTAGKAIELESDGEALTRGQLLESQYLSALELNLLRPAGEAEFDADVLDNRRYNVVYLASRFADDTTPLTLESGLGTWAIDGDGNVTQALDVATVSRDNTGTVTRAPTAAVATNWLVSPRTSTLSTGQRDIGRLNLDISTASEDEERPEVGVGAGTPDGAFLAFNLDDSPFGDGLLVAAGQAISAAPGSGRYRVQGVSMGLSGGTNELRHFDNAELVINGGTATLSGEAISVINTVNGNQVTTPSETVIDTTLTYAQSAPGTISLTSSNLALDGFYTDDHSQMYLRLNRSGTGSQAVGLLLATRIP